MSEERKALVPVEEKTVIFYGDELVAVRVPAEEGAPGIYVPLKPIADNIGLDWSSQYRRVQRDPILEEVSELIAVTAIKSQRGNPDALCLPLKFLPGWLFGVSVNRVREELREKVLRYQRECYDVLWEAFQEGRLTADPAFSDLAESDSPAAVAYRMASAVMRLARQQLILEAQQEAHADTLADHERRLEDIEITLGDPDRVITPEQAMHLSQAVKGIAYKLGERSGRNEYGGVWGEFYRRFKVPTYRELPATRFDEVMGWLREWWAQLTDDEVPF